MVIAILAEAAHSGETVLARYLELVTDPAHWMLEITIMIIIDLLIISLAIPYIRKRIERHDREVHGHETAG